MSSLDARWRPTAALGRAIVTAAVAVAGCAAARRPGPGRARGAVRGAGGARPAAPPDPRAAVRRPARPRVAARGPGHDVAADRRRRRRRGAPHPRARAAAVRRAAAPRGQVGALLTGPDGPAPAIELSPRRWGRRFLGEEKVALVTARGPGYRFGPVSLGGQQMRVLPTTAPYDSRARRPAAGRPGRRAPVAAPRRRHRAGRHPAVHAGRPAAPDQLAGLAAHRASCTWSAPAPRRTPACCWWSTRWPTTASRAASTASRAAWTSRCARPRRSPSTTSARATGWRCGWSAADASWSATARAPGTCGGCSTPWPASGSAMSPRRTRRRFSSASPAAPW